MSRDYIDDPAEASAFTLRDIRDTLDHIADVVERIADAIAPTPEQIEDRKFHESADAIRLAESLAKIAAQWGPRR